nr:hypothetical protein [Tanacetum cinerariifolium]
EVKAVEEICVTCGGAHPYYQCLAADGNTFPEYRDNIQGYVSAATGNYNQGNLGYRPPGVANQIRPPGLAQPNIQNNQNRFSQPQRYNRGNNFNQDQSYQAPNQQNQVVPLIFFQINTASTSGLGNLPSNTIANPKGELKDITTRSGIVLDGPSVPISSPFINPEEDERVEETYTIKVPPPLVQKPKPPSQRNFVLHINITLADALILILKYQKSLKALLSNKEKLLELANTPLNENCSAVILKKLPEKLKDPGKFLISCGFSELKCKALADLGASINFMPLFFWKKLGLPELISTRMTLELANRAIYTPARIARDVFVPVGKFTFSADFVIVDYDSDPRVPLILGRPFLRTARALIDVHGEEMILRDGDERLTFNMRHDTLSYSNQPQKESINMINIYDDSSEGFLENLFATNHQSSNPTFSSHPNLTSPEVKVDVFNPERGNVLIEKLLDLDSTKDLHPPHHINPLSGSTTSSSPNHLLEDNLAGLNDNLVDTMLEMFTDEHALDYSSPPLYDEYNDDLFEVESNIEYVYDDPFYSKGEKIKESKLLIDELDLPSDFLPSFEYDSFPFEDFSKVNALPSTNNEDKVFNPCILIRENLFKVITRVALDKNDKKLAISHASLIPEDFDPPLYELSFFKEIPRSKTLLSFSSENEKKAFKPWILTSKGVHSSLIPELFHRGYKVFKIIKILKSPMEIFLFSHGKNIRILDQVLQVTLAPQLLHGIRHLFGHMIDILSRSYVNDTLQGKRSRNLFLITVMENVYDTTRECEINRAATTTIGKRIIGFYWIYNTVEAEMGAKSGMKGECLGAEIVANTGGLGR